MKKDSKFIATVANLHNIANDIRQISSISEEEANELIERLAYAKPIQLRVNPRAYDQQWSIIREPDGRLGISNCIYKSESLN